MNIIPIDNIPDWEMRIKRHDAFWENQIIDRPLVHICCPGKNTVEYPDAPSNSWKECWYNVEFQTERRIAWAKNTAFMGDMLPFVYPDVGPDIFATCYGGEIEFEESTSYIKHFLNNWQEFKELSFSRQREYMLKIEELYDAFFELGKGIFYVGQPDLHPGADCLVGLRGPSELCMDLFDDPVGIKEALKIVEKDFYPVFDYFIDKAFAHNQPITGWPTIVSTKKWHVPSNDFSYMISPEQFNEFFLEGIKRECDHAEASIYHLDGKGALCHLDSLLEIESLNAVQWVFGAGNGRATDWLDVYKKVQAKNKGLQIPVEPDEIDCIKENLSPEGVHLIVRNVSDKEMGEAVLKKISSWK